ncbi:MAG TPA: cbb3-type cytochrome oxidase assembly protein CcoS [Candidatus Eisenbacteria bacterium]|jgi:cbb3-type cytochrome oxidase maturation protein
MGVMYVIVPIALAVVFAAVLAFLWAASRGQFDDLTTPALRALHDDPAPGDDAAASASAGAVRPAPVTSPRAGELDPASRPPPTASPGMADMRVDHPNQR